MIYGAIWFGGAWLYWLIWLVMWLMNWNVPLSVTVFVTLHLPTILVFAAIVASVVVYNKRKKTKKPEGYDRSKHFRNLGIITGLIILTVLAYLWLLIKMLEAAM